MVGWERVFQNACFCFDQALTSIRENDDGPVVTLITAINNPFDFDCANSIAVGS
ncbi:hypothetical protein NW765_017661 [Fusarium oxysporum]|nr:hypothetical protein NW765_017661 [Fusarium oxysporum]KAJ4257613.1 hypothetical protein NW764_016303 [Fusarium oxysporum]